MLRKATRGRKWLPTPPPAQRLPAPQIRFLNLERITNYCIVLYCICLAISPATRNMIWRQKLEKGVDRRCCCQKPAISQITRENTIQQVLFKVQRRKNNFPKDGSNILHCLMQQKLNNCPLILTKVLFFKHHNKEAYATDYYWFSEQRRNTDLLTHQ